VFVYNLFIYLGLIDCTRKIYRQHGFFGLFKGFNATFIRDAIGFTAFFGIFEQFSRWMSEEEPPYRDITVAGHMLAGTVFFVHSLLRELQSSAKN